MDSDMSLAKKPSAPTGIKLVAIFFLILGMALAVHSLYGVFLVGIFSSVDESPIGSSAAEGIISRFLLLKALAQLILFSLAGIGLWHGKKWARIVAVVLLAILVFPHLFYAFDIFYDLQYFDMFYFLAYVKLFLYMAIGVYLLFSASAKKYLIL